MNPLLDAALAYAQLGWAIFPLSPGVKVPTAGSHGFKDASTEVDRIREWWSENPRYNVAIACGASNLAVLDIDYGLKTKHDAYRFAQHYKIPLTRVVRTGKRTAYGLHFYFVGQARTGDFELPGGISGQVKSTGGYVLAPPSIHPISGECYELLKDMAPAAVLDWILLLTAKEPKRIQGDSEEKVGRGNRHGFLVARASELWFVGFRGKNLVKALEMLYRDRCERDADMDARITGGESEAICAWVESHPPDYPLTKNDYIQLHKTAETDQKVLSAWGGQLALFGGDAVKAQNYLIAGLERAGCNTEQIQRIGKAAPLNEIAAATIPEYLKGKE